MRLACTPCRGRIPLRTMNVNDPTNAPTCEEWPTNFGRWPFARHACCEVGPAHKVICAVAFAELPKTK